MNAPTRPPVEATPRKAFTKAQRAAVFLAGEGKCYLCGEKITGPFDIDHRIALHHGGAHEMANWAPAHPACHRAKTKGDVKASAKIKRLIARESGTRRERKAIQSRGFDKSLSKGFDGKVRRRDILTGMALGFVLGVVTLGYLNDKLSAREASYSERPPERYLNAVGNIALIYEPSIEAVNRRCVLMGMPKRNQGHYYGCAWPSGLVILPDPCLFKGAERWCAGEALTVAVCRSRGFWPETACHEWGHAAGGWPADHRR